MQGIVGIRLLSESVALNAVSRDFQYLTRAQGSGG